MDEGEYTSLVAALAGVEDPRRARGRRYPWGLLWTLIAAAMVSGERHGHGIGQWVQEHRDELRSWLGCAQLPSEATLRRAAQTVDPVAVDQQISQWVGQVEWANATGNLQGYAVDGKEVRGSRAHGRVEHLLSLVRHDGVVLQQLGVERKTNELTAAPQLLAERGLQGMVLTVDALLTQRALAQQIHAAGGHYLMVVKGNQPDLEQAITTWFAGERPAVTAGREADRLIRTHEKGHGRLETRTLEASSALHAWLAWPAQQQVLKRTCRRVKIRTGEVSEQVTYAVTSLAPEQASPAKLEQLWRGHWGIENKVHYIRDVTFGEDAGQAHTGATAHVLAAVRNAILNLLRAQGWHRIADALRHFGANVVRALTIVGGLPSRL